MFCWFTYLLTVMMNEAIHIERAQHWTEWSAAWTKWGFNHKSDALTTTRQPSSQHARLTIARSKCESRWPRAVAQQPWASCSLHPGPGLTQPSILKWSVNGVPAYLAGVNAGCVQFTCVGQQVILCDPIWQVTLRSCEMELHTLHLISLKHEYNKHSRTHLGELDGKLHRALTISRP